MHNPTIKRDQGSQWRYITSVFGVDTYECIDNCIGLYLVKQEYDSNGNPLNHFKVLNGYESRFAGILNIVGTFSERIKFYTTQCSWFPKCTLITTMPQLIQFVGNSREYRYYNFYSSCPWQVTNVPDYIEFTQTSGEGGIEISLGIRNTLLPEETQTDFFILEYGNNYVMYNVEVNVADLKIKTISNDGREYGMACNDDPTLTESEVTDGGQSAKGELIQAIVGDCVNYIGDNAFSGAINLTDVTYAEDTILGVNDYAFANCRSLRNIDVPDTVITVGNHAYQGCENAETIYLGQWLESIGDYAFDGCRRIASVMIPNEVTEIGMNAFSNCPNLQEVGFGDGLTEIPFSCFSNCVSLGEVEIPVGVETIDDFAFYNCTSLVNAYLPYTVASIGDSAFLNCTSLNAMNFNQGLESVGDNAFNSCSSLQSVSFANDIQSIGDYAFANCYRLNGITIEATTPPTLGAGAFDNTNNCPIYIPCESWHLYQGSESWESVSDRLQPIEDVCPVKAVIRSATKKINIPCGNTNILTKEDINATRLRQTAIEAEIYDTCCTKINWETFSGCTNLQKVTIGDSVTEISNYAFQDCQMLSEIKLPSGLTSVGYLSFANCASLSSVTLPDSMTSIDSFAFSDCSNLKDVYIPCDTGNYGFQSCISLTSVTLGNNVTAIDGNSFNGCSSLPSITIPNSVTIIHSGAFTNCTNLSAITVPNSVTEVNAGAFSNCTSLTTAQLSTKLTAISSLLFNNCTSLTSVNIPSGVTRISTSAFSKCINLPSITIPNKVKRIDSEAFSDCWKLNHVTIPSAVTTIGQAAFQGCSTLEYIRLEGNTPPTLGERAFDGTNNCPIYVDCSVLGDYLRTDGWSVYRDRIVGESRSTSCVLKVILTARDEEIETYCDDTSTLDEHQIEVICTRAKKEKKDITDAKIGLCVDTLDNTFNDYYNLSSVTIADSVTTIGDNAFQHCTNLSAITIPSGVTTIGDNAFKTCNNLSAVTIPNVTTTIGESAFQNCYELTSINIPDSVTEVGNDAFHGCRALTSATISSGLTVIPNNLFYGCINLNNVVIPNGVTEIGDSAFYHCANFSTIEIPDSVESIGSTAFYACSNLSSVTIGDSVEIIKNSAFQACHNLKRVIIGYSVEEIQDQAFLNCPRLQEIRMTSEKAPVLGKNVFAETNNCPIFVPCMIGYLKEPTWSPYWNRLVEYGGGCSPALTANYSDGTQYNVYCADLDNDSQTVLTKEKVREHTTLYREMTSATVGDCVTELDRAFDGCTKLTSITLGNNLKTI